MRAAPAALLAPGPRAFTSSSAHGSALAFGIELLILVVVTGASVYAWRSAIVLPYRDARQHLERLSMALAGLAVSDVAHAGLRKLMPWPIARGVRGSFAVALSLRHGMKHERASTRIDVMSPGGSGPRVGIGHASSCRLGPARASHWSPWRRWSATRASDRWVEVPWFGRAVAWGEPSSFDQLFDAHVRAALQAFGGELTLVAHDGAGTVSIHWYGIEEDPAIVEEALGLGARVLERALANGAIR